MRYKYKQTHYSMCVFYSCHAEPVILLAIANMDGVSFPWECVRCVLNNRGVSRVQYTMSVAAT